MNAAASWTLGDAAARASENPYTFWKPSGELIARLGPGNFAKLIFEFASDDPEAPGAERMWVRITGRTGDRFEGVLDNEPRYIRDLAPGAVVRFDPRHVIDSDLTDTVPDPTRAYRPRCIVSNRVLNDGAAVGYLYREAPDHDDDSGWRILAGDEDEAYVDDASNCRAVSLGAVLSVDDSIRDLLGTPAPCAFERNRESGAFVAVPPPGQE